MASALPPLPNSMCLSVLPLSSPHWPSLPLPLSLLLTLQYRFRFKYHLLSSLEQWGLDLHLEGNVFQGSPSAFSPNEQSRFSDKVCDLGL